ncbi:AAA family ATPase [Arsukibacterium sp.]|uniref:AAA family ATPase n=1 Tax=Arsukibacterium sp. TaxID=1977258 RepID=UPI001BD4FB7D|nr:AAA family ATPase [Arsukibacterium sp.]
MIIKSLHVEKFRGFKNLEFDLGKQITLIAGQNGTQKSTLLGMLTQTFSIGKEHAMHGQVPLSGGSFRSSFSDKFRLSPKFDIPKEHEWTLTLSNSSETFTIESIPRKNATSHLRFWRKGNRNAGSGYLQLPVIFLSLKRLLPNAEESGFDEDPSVTLSADEIEFYKKWYRTILISEDKLEKVDYLKSKNKETAGVTSDHYDWRSNSAGQDNIGKILLAIISFKRLKDSFPDEYKGGILAIDEIDASLYSGAQIKLLEALMNFSSKLNIQILATTHSMPMIDKALEISQARGRESSTKVIYLKKSDGLVTLEKDLSAEKLKNHLDVSLGKVLKLTVDIFSEDEECRDFLRACLGRKFKGLNYVDCTLGCENLIQLAKQKVPAFLHPNSLVVVDGDVAPQKIAKYKNYIALPGNDSPEKVLATFLNGLSDADPFWGVKNASYNKQICFRDFSVEDIHADRIKAKKWYNDQKSTGVWGLGASELYKRYFKENPKEKNDFTEKFKFIYDEIIKHKGFESLIA